MSESRPNKKFTTPTTARKPGERTAKKKRQDEVEMNASLLVTDNVETDRLLNNINQEV